MSPSLKKQLLPADALCSMCHAYLAKQSCERKDQALPKARDTLTCPPWMRSGARDHTDQICYPAAFSFQSRELGWIIKVSCIRWHANVEGLKGKMNSLFKKEFISWDGYRRLYISPWLWTRRRVPFQTFGHCHSGLAIFLGTRSWVVLTPTLLQFVIVFFILRDKWPSWHRIFWVYLLARHASSESSPGMCHGDRPGSWKKCSHPWDSIKTSWRNTVYTSPVSKYPNLFVQVFTCKSTKRQTAYPLQWVPVVWNQPTNFGWHAESRVRPLVFPKGPIFLGQKFLVKSYLTSSFVA